ncbi:MAG: hypothetical protein AB7T63_15660 [Planctomycetota bacterium]
MLFVSLLPGSPSATGSEGKKYPLLLVRRLAVQGDGRPRFAGWALKRDAEEEQVQQAIARGCAWLVAHQHEDGSFLGEASPEYRTGLSALALVALLDAGHGPDDATTEGASLRNGIALLLASQDEDGCVGPRVGERAIYGHAYGTYALVRAYEVARGAALERAVQAALDFTALARNPYFGWRYGIRPGDNDTDVSGCMMLAVAEAEAVNGQVASGEPPVFRLDAGAMEGVRTWLMKVTDSNTGRVGYLTRGSGPARYDDKQMEWFQEHKSESMTAVGCWFRLRHGEDPSEAEVVQRGLQRIAKLPPEWNTLRGGLDQYFWMWGARVAHELDRWGGKAASKLDGWRAQAVAALLSAQEGGTNAFTDAGSWPPDGAWGRWGGRVYSTALAVSTLKLSAYRGALRSEGGAKERIGRMRDRDADLDERLAAIESVSAGAPDEVVQALAALARDPVPLVRLTAVEALSRLGPDAASTAARLAKQLGAEKRVEIRHALLFALLRIGKSSKSIVDALTRATADPDPGVRALAQLVHEAIVSVEPSAELKRLARWRSAAELLAFLEDGGQLGLEGLPARGAAVRWRLLRDIGLPHHLGARAGQRLAILPTSPLERLPVLEAVEKALAAAPLAGMPRPEARALYDAAVAEVEACPDGPGERTRLAAALELHLARFHVGAAGPITGEIVARLHRHRAALRALAPTLQELERDACRVIELRCVAAIEALAPEDSGAEVVEGLAAALDEHAAMAGAFYAYPDLVRWVELAGSYLLERLGRATQDPAAMARARDLALDVVVGPVDTLDGRRVALHGATQAARLAPFIGVSRVASPLGRELPLTAMQQATSSGGLRVELLDVAFQQVPLLAPGNVCKLSAREQLVVRVRTTPMHTALAWSERDWRLVVRVRRGAAPEQVHLMPYAPEPTPLAVDDEALGGTTEPTGTVPEGQSVVTVHVFGTTESELGAGVEVTLRIRRDGGEEAERLVATNLPASAILREVPWTRLVEATKDDLLQRLPDIDASPEGVDALLVVAALEARGGLVDVARATAARAEAAAEALGDAARTERARALLASIVAK